ncbi:MAG TPA: IdeS/Mac family cysteine endopeptidase [Lachnospiraceae bacterium]
MKKIINKNNQPKYGLRKLSIGLVSCVLGFTTILSPLATYASELSEIENYTEESPLFEESVALENEKNVEETDVEVSDTAKDSEEEILAMESSKVKVTLKERKVAENVHETIMLDGVSINEDEFENIKNDKEDYFAAEHGKGSGYYDVNKKMDGEDSLLCSGVVAVNMFHWWLDQNKENVEKYLKQNDKNGVIILNNKEVTRISKIKELYAEEKQSGKDPYVDQSKFFDLIKDSFENQALMTDGLLNMYINGYGNEMSAEKARNTELNHPSSINFFNKVFHGEVLTDAMVITGLDELSSKVKEALENKRAMGVSYAADRYKGAGHIISLWGADFDKDGKLIAVYVTDSDDRIAGLDSLEKRRIGMKRYKVSDESGLVRFTGYTEKGSGGSLRHFYTLDRGQSAWEKYFQENPFEEKENMDMHLPEEEMIPKEEPSPQNESLPQNETLPKDEIEEKTPQTDYERESEEQESPDTTKDDLNPKTNESDEKHEKHSIYDNPYMDVNESDWYYDAVMYAKESGYMTGVNANHFNPGAYLQRQDFALALMRHYMSKGKTVTEKEDGTYYGKAIAWAKKMGIMKGYSNGNFGVGDLITRQDCIVALDRYMKVWGMEVSDPTKNPNYKEQMNLWKSTYADADKVGDYAFSVMFKAVLSDGLIKGVDKNGGKYLDPTGHTTRGTISVMMQRWFEKYADIIK